MDDAANAIDLRFSETSIMDTASSLASEILSPSELSSFSAPASFSSFMTNMVGGNDTQSTEITNSKLIGILCNDIVRSIYTLGPGVDTGPDRADRLGSMYHSSHNEALATGSTAGGHAGMTNLSPLRYRTKLERPCWSGPGVALSNGPTDTFSMRASVIATTLSNVLIASAGIGRLEGAELGQRFSVTDGLAGLEKAFGALPLTRSISDIPGSTAGPRMLLPMIDLSFEEGSILDSVVIGETLGNSEMRILPFEGGSYPDQTNPPVVSGRDYFTELPIRFPTAGRSNDFSSFSTSFTSIVKDALEYLNELYAIDQDTNLSPEKILAIVLQEFALYLDNLSLPPNSKDWNKMAALSCKLFDQATRSSTTGVDAYFDDFAGIAAADSNGHSGLSRFYAGATLSSAMGTSGLSTRTMLARQAFLLSSQYDSLLADDEKLAIPVSSGYSLYSSEVHANDPSLISPFKIAMESNFTSGLSTTTYTDGSSTDGSLPPSTLAQIESAILLRDICNAQVGSALGSIRALDATVTNQDPGFSTAADDLNVTDYLTIDEGEKR